MSTDVGNQIIDLMEELRKSLARPEPAADYREVPEPGIYLQVDMRRYLSWRAVSSGALSQIEQSPAHARAYTDPLPEVGNDDTTATIVGTAAHCAVLEPDVFDRSYLRGPPGNWSLKAPKDAVAAMRAANPGCIVLKPEKYDAVLRARDAIQYHPGAWAALDEGGPRESSVVWVDQASRVLCKARPDLLVPDWGTIVDLKSTTDASWSGFQRAIGAYHYHRKAAFYIDAMRAAGDEYEHFLFISFEKVPPYAVAVYELEPRDIELGRRQNRALLNRWAECAAADEWPAYPESITYIGLGDWARKEIEL